MRNKDRLNQWQREYYQRRKSDPKYISRKRKSAERYYQKNIDDIRSRAKKYRLANKVHYNEYRRKWVYETPQGIYSVLNRRTKRVGLTKDDFVQWWGKQEQVCTYCKRDITACRVDPLNRGMRRLTIDRVDNDKPYELGNLALACRRCNTVKNNYFTKMEMLEIGNIIRKKV